MKKSVKLGLALAIALAFAASVRAETFKKLHSSPQLIISSTLFNDSNEPTSSTVDLSGGDLDKCAFLVVASSAAGTTTMSLAIQVSPDGGTSWVPTGDTITVSTSVALGDTVRAYGGNKNVSGGTKLRVVPTLASSCTYYTFKLYALPSVD